MKTVNIGDIHGCSSALQTILRELDPDPAAERLVLLGDLFDRGSARSPEASAWCAVKDNGGWHMHGFVRPGSYIYYRELLQ